MFYEPANPEDDFGLVEEYPLEGGTLSRHLEPLLGSLTTDGEAQDGVFRTRLVSRKLRTISGLEAVELVTEGAYTVIEVNIRKGDRVIRVSFRALKESFPELEPAFRSSLDSIKVE